MRSDKIDKQGAKMTENNGRIPMQFATQNRQPRQEKLSPDIKVVGDLSADQLEEVTNLIYIQYPDFIKAIK